MTAYVARRLGIAVLMVFVITSLAFILTALMPNDVTSTILGPDATPEQRSALRSDLGLDEPLISRFIGFWASALTGDLGSSLISGRPVLDSVTERLPVTLTLAMGGTLLAVIVGVALGTLAAVRGGATDTTIRGFVGVVVAIPNFWLAVLLVFVFAVTLGLFPATGWTPFPDDPGDWALHLVLPLSAIVVGASAGIVRQSRVAMLDVLQRDYITTLRSVGLPEWRIILVHGLRNAAIPVLTVIGLTFVGLFGGAVLIEQVFSLPGIGPLAMTSVSTGDFPVTLGVVIVTSALILLMNLALDIVYGIINPKARLA
ncbi:ABC transporter permease [Microbacter sp. GSS18]|nr:ABC transporter permease [Microbacter sp. GSS18]